MSTQIGMSSCCLSGAVHTGTPAGREEKIGGIDTYITEPEGGSKAKSVVFIVDIFGWKFKNTRLLADQYAKAGFYCYVPDAHEGDSLPAELLKSIEPPLKTKEEGLIDEAKEKAEAFAILGPWIGKHGPEQAEPLISGFIDAVKQIPGTGKVGAIGFCWGGKYAILQAHKREAGQPGGVDAAYTCHPSLLAIPDDLDKVSAPTSVAVGEKDSLLDMPSVDQIKAALEKTGAPVEVVVYKDQVHGFALRSDWSTDADKKAMDDAQKQGIAWFDKYLS